MEEEDRWIQARNILEVWANERGYFIDFRKDGDNSICSVSKIIEINSSIPVETQVYYLLHECGHALIFDNGSFYNFEQIKKAHPEENDYHRVFVILEEAEAWKRAYNLAKRLFIDIDEDRWKSEVVDALSKYVKWAAKIDWENNDANES
jgi:hypothetical protein